MFLNSRLDITELHDNLLTKITDGSKGLTSESPEGVSEGFSILAERIITEHDVNLSTELTD